jgi:uncharacterized phage infection (PIP) family protein YhgE
MIKLFSDYSSFLYFLSFVVILCTTYPSALDIQKTKTKQSIRDVEIEKSWEFTFAKFFSWVYFTIKYSFINVLLFLAEKPVSIFIYVTTLFAMYCATK